MLKPESSARACGQAQQWHVLLGDLRLVWAWLQATLEVGIEAGRIEAEN